MYGLNTRFFTAAGQYHLVNNGVYKYYRIVYCHMCVRLWVRVCNNVFCAWLCRPTCVIACTSAFMCESVGSCVSEPTGGFLRFKCE